MSNETTVEQPPAESAAKPEKSVLEHVFAFFASFGLACVIMTLLTLLTFVGTINMEWMGLYQTSQVYFYSWFVLRPFPMPGGMLLMILLFLNLLCGAIIRARKSWKRPGMLIAHGGMLFLLVAGWVSYQMTREGNLPLWESSEFGAEFDRGIGGAIVTAVEADSAASRAGLQVDDLLLSVTEPGDDDTLGTPDDEVLTIADYRQDQSALAAEQFTSGKAGEKLRIKVDRDGTEIEMNVLFYGDSGDESFNLTDWTLEIGEYTGDELPEKVIVVQPEALQPLLKKGARRVFFSESLPFEVEISNYLRNCEPRPLTGSASGKHAVDGFYLHEKTPEPEEESNFRGANVRILPKGGGAPIYESLLFGDYPGMGITAPLTVEIDGKRFAVNLTKQRTTLPFKIRLEKFRAIKHPRTRKAKEFTSNVTKIDPNGTTESTLIEMNQPLRSDGYTVYQASWGPQNAGPDDLRFTSLVVAQNPADQWPKYACYVVSVGLTIHFIQKLYFYIHRMIRKRRRIQEAIAANAPK